MADQQWNWMLWIQVPFVGREIVVLINFFCFSWKTLRERKANTVDLAQSGCEIWTFHTNVNIMFNISSTCFDIKLYANHTMPRRLCSLPVYVKYFRKIMHMVHASLFCSILLIPCRVITLPRLSQCQHSNPGLYSLSGRASYRKISRRHRSREIRA